MGATGQRKNGRHHDVRQGFVQFMRRVTAGKNFNRAGDPSD